MVTISSGSTCKCIYISVYFWGFSGFFWLVLFWGKWALTSDPWPQRWHKNWTLFLPGCERCEWRHREGHRFGPVEHGNACREMSFISLSTLRWENSPLSHQVSGHHRRAPKTPPASVFHGPDRLGHEDKFLRTCDISTWQLIKKQHSPLYLADVWRSMALRFIDWSNSHLRISLFFTTTSPPQMLSALIAYTHSRKGNALSCSNAGTFCSWWWP